MFNVFGDPNNVPRPKASPIHERAHEREIEERRLVTTLGSTWFEVRRLTFRVLDAFRPWGATWSGQVIFSPPGPSGRPFMTHPLPRGEV